MKLRVYSIFLLLLVTFPVYAENILMARARDSFEVTLEVAQKSLEAHGYTVSHIQRCDGGLKDFGFTTDPYRILFFGKPEEIRHLTGKYPELIPFLPLKMAVFDEDKEVLAVVFNPIELGKLFNNKELEVQFKRWKNDFDSILGDIRGH